MPTTHAEEVIQEALEGIRDGLPVRVVGWDVFRGVDSVGEPALYVDAKLANDDETDRQALTDAHDSIWRTAMNHRDDDDLWVYVRYVVAPE